MKRKKQIQSLLIQNENNDEEIKKLKKYQLFLDQQLLSFDQRIKKIEREMKAFKENTPLEEKKKKHFKMFMVWKKKRTIR
ncbi:hypothetical protein [Candidatus Phytoplasma ziziphi]|uniref:hypothetical protein n=1 Tax=Ziziphus jujuba witches'-broom phytoplasma TaxID=135727 RepID=UPI001EDCB23D|nr:hypothetical protein [Candidatus Phytoplasma ziziphi]